MEILEDVNGWCGTCPATKLCLSPAPYHPEQSRGVGAGSKAADRVAIVINYFPTPVPSLIREGCPELSRGAGWGLIFVVPPKIEIMNFDEIENGHDIIAAADLAPIIVDPAHRNFDNL